MQDLPPTESALAAFGAQVDVWSASPRATTASDQGLSDWGARRGAHRQGYRDQILLVCRQALLDGRPIKQWTPKIGFVKRRLWQFQECIIGLFDRLGLQRCWRPRKRLTPFHRMSSGTFAGGAHKRQAKRPIKAVALVERHRCFCPLCETSAGAMFPLADGFGHCG